MGRSARPRWRMIGEVFAGSRNAQPGRVFLESGEEIFKPAVFVAVGVGAGPDTEFFHVIAHRCHAARMQSCRIAQVGDDLFDFAEGDEVTERFLTGEEPDALTAVFGDVGAKEFLGLKSSGKKMNVVDQSVVDGGCGKRGGKLRLPDTLGDPGAGRTMAEMFFEIGGQAGDLFALVLGRDGDENGFVKAAADQLDLSGADEGFQAREIFGTMLFDPGEQRTGIVQAHVDAGMFFEKFDERADRSLCRPFRARGRNCRRAGGRESERTR